MFLPVKITLLSGSINCNCAVLPIVSIASCAFLAPASSIEILFEPSIDMLGSEIPKPSTLWLDGCY